MTRDLPSFTCLLSVSGALAALVGTFHAVPANAQELEGQIGVATQYVGKGVGKSAEDPSVFGSAEVSSGAFYASVFASTAELSQGSDAEIISAIGYRPEVAGFDLDLAVINRDLPGTRAGVDGNYMEYQADVSRKLGRISTRLRFNYTPDGFAGTQEAWWIEAQGAVALHENTKASAAIASRTADGGAEYVAWNAGVKHKLTDRVALDVRWFDTDGHSYGEAYEGRLVGALSVSF
jgi:uncharacterized protein (TIGR02001 family)